MSYSNRSETSRTAWFVMSWLDLENSRQCMRPWARSRCLSACQGAKGRGNLLDAKLQLLEALGKLVHKLGLYGPARNRGRHSLLGGKAGVKCLVMLVESGCGESCGIGESRVTAGPFINVERGQVILECRVHGSLRRKVSCRKARRDSEILFSKGRRGSLSLVGSESRMVKPRGPARKMVGYGRVLHNPTMQ